MQSSAWSVSVYRGLESTSSTPLLHNIIATPYNVSLSVAQCGDGQADSNLCRCFLPLFDEPSIHCLVKPFEKCTLQRSTGPGPHRASGPNHILPRLTAAIVSIRRRLRCVPQKTRQQSEVATIGQTTVISLESLYLYILNAPNDFSQNGVEMSLSA